MSKMSIDYKIEIAHENVFSKIGEKYGSRTIIAAMCPINKFDAQNVGNYLFKVECSCGSITFNKPYDIKSMQKTEYCLHCRPPAIIAEEYVGKTVAFLDVLEKIRTVVSGKQNIAYYKCKCNKCEHIYEVKNKTLKFYSNGVPKINGSHIRKVPEFCPMCYTNGVKSSNSKELIGLKYGVMESISFARSEKGDPNSKSIRSSVYLNVKCHCCDSIKEVQIASLKRYTKPPLYCKQPGCVQLYHQKIKSGEIVLNEMDSFSQINPFNPDSKKNIHRDSDKVKKMTMELIPKDKGCFINTKLVKISTNYKNCEFELTCKCGGVQNVKYNTILNYIAKKPITCKKCIGLGRFLPEDPTVKLFNDKYDVAKKEAIGTVCGPYTIMDIIPTNDIYRTMNTSDVILQCNKCKDKTKKSFLSFNSLRGKLNKKDFNHTGCEKCTPNELNISKLRYIEGFKISDTKTITKVIKSHENTLLTTKFEVYCSCCNKKRQYAYSTIVNMEKNPTKCMTCTLKLKRRKSIELYKSLIGKEYGIYKIVKCYKYRPDNNHSKYTTECTKCGNHAIKTLAGLVNAKDKKILFCHKCPDKKYDTIRTSKDEDLSGMRFGIFKVLNFSHSDIYNGSRIWLTQCNCGTLSKRSTGQLTLLIRGKKQEYCNSCIDTLNNKFKPGDKLENGTEIISMDQDTKKITFVCGNCGKMHTVTMGAFNIKLNTGKNTCNNCSKETHGDSTTKFYKEWVRIIHHLTYHNIPFDDRWIEYLNFKEDFKDSYIEDSVLESKNGTWNKTNCGWVPKD